MALKRLSDEVESIIIGEKKIGPGEPCFIIAEAGVNHNGNIKIAIKLIQAAKEAGADVVKFQTAKPEQVTIAKSPTAKYQQVNTGETSQLELIRPLLLPESDNPRLVEEAKKAGIMFMSTPHGHVASAKFLIKDVPAWKVGSGDVTNLPFLKYLGTTNKPIILSTGMATIEEIKEAVETIEPTGNKQLIILQCTSMYPTIPEEANVSAMLDIQKHFPDYPVGFSDHTLGTEAVILAVALGATVVEKHFTLDKNMPGPDQKNSLEPDELKLMVKEIREMESMKPDKLEETVAKIPKVKALMGSGVKKPFASELETAEMARKSVVTVKSVKAGEIITKEALSIKRPEKGGLRPKMLGQIVGKIAKRDIEIDTQVRLGDF